jgi:hypothetical protein
MGRECSTYEIRNAYKIFVGKPEEKRPPFGYKDSIKV